MKDFFKKLWENITNFFKSYNWKIKLFSKGIRGLNKKGDIVQHIVPSLFLHFTESYDIGLIWFGFGIKLNVSKKQTLPDLPPQS